VAADITIQFTGTLTGEVFSGTYVAYISSTLEGVDSGTFSMTRSALGLTADFTANVTSGPAPLTVNFTNLSQGQYSSLSWTFGDGGTSSQENPTHTYNNPGTYTVTLTVIGPGGSDTETKTNYIAVGQAPQAPVADFSGSPTSDFAPATVDFTDLSTGTIDEWSWTFEGGDPGTSNQRNPSNIYYLLPGTYTVTLTVTGPGGSDTETKTGYITVEDPRPKADFSAVPDSGMAPLLVQFTDLSTGNVTSREWDFGDGSDKVSTKDPSHTYQNPGTYNAKLKVTAPGLLGSDEKTKTITVTAPPPVARFTASTFHGASPLEVQFTDQSTGDINTRTWNFGGGTQVGGGQTDPRVRYDSIGLYNVTLNPAGPGGSSSASAQIFVYQVIYVSKNDAGCGGNSPCRTKLQDAF
jgi:PKD repeat protein